jgi:hypothetical protein
VFVVGHPVAGLQRCVTIKERYTKRDDTFHPRCLGSVTDGRCRTRRQYEWQ